MAPAAMPVEVQLRSLKRIDVILGVDADDPLSRERGFTERFRAFEG